VARRPSAASREKDPAAAGIRRFFSLELFFSFFCISHIIQLTPQQQSAESRNNAGASALAVAKDQKRHRGRTTRPPPVSRGSSP